MHCLCALQASHFLWLIVSLKWDCGQAYLCESVILKSHVGIRRQIEYLDWGGIILFGWGVQKFSEKYYPWGFWGRVMDLKRDKGGMQCISCDKVLKGQGRSQFSVEEFPEGESQEMRHQQDFWRFERGIVYCWLCCCSVAKSCLTPCDPMDCIAHQAPLSMGILQARTLEWVAMPSSRGSSQPSHQT